MAWRKPGQDGLNKGGRASTAFRLSVFLDQSLDFPCPTCILMTMSHAADTGSVPPAVKEAIERAYKVAREQIENCNLKEHWGESIDYLDENFAFFLTHVLNMGQPEWLPAIKTAAVALPHDGANLTDFRYIFNPTFAALMSPEEFAFIQAHETMHVLLNHLRLLETGKKRGKFKNPQKFNVAADCVINDYLVSMGLDAGRIRQMGCFGEDIVGYDCSNSTVSEVYLDIPDDQSDENGEGEGEGGGGTIDGTGQGSLGEYMDGDSKSSATGQHDWMHDPESAKQADAADAIGKDAAKNAGLPQDLEDKKQDDDNKGTPGAGPGSEAGAMRQFTEQKNVSMKWAELLKEVNPDFFKSGGPKMRPSYHRSPRKLAGVYGSPMFRDLGVLPVQREPQNPRGQTPSIVMFMDGSGSCSDWIDTFCTLSKSVPPKKMHLRAWTFSTYCTPFDVTADKNSMATGGTAFSPIEDTIQKEVVPELGHYPHAVVVMTDMEGAFSGSKPEEKNRANWLWLKTHEGRYDYRGSDKWGKEIRIEDFCEGMENLPKGGRSW